MTDRPARVDLLPSHAYPRERAIADTDGRLEDIDFDLIRRVRSPDETPEGFLAYLAWERSVDVWDPTWSIEIKRAVVTAAPVVHRYKGTRYAVEAALAALQVDARFEEWFDQVPRGPAYTFTVRANARARLYDGPVLDARLIRVVYASIMRAKPLSRAFRLVVGATFPQTLGLVPVAAGKVTVRRAASPRLAVQADQPLGLAPIAAGKVTVRRAVSPRLSVQAATPLGLAAATLGRVVVRRAVIL